MFLMDVVYLQVQIMEMEISLQSDQHQIQTHRAIAPKTVIDYLGQGKIGSGKT